MRMAVGAPGDGGCRERWSAATVGKFPCWHLATRPPAAQGACFGPGAPTDHDREVDDLTRLALEAGAGDQAVLAALVRRTQAEVWRLCAHLVDPQAADDLTQETYLRAVAALRRFRGDSSVRTWLLVIARRTCADELRRRVRRRRLDARVEQQARTRVHRRRRSRGRLRHRPPRRRARARSARRLRAHPVAGPVLRRGRRGLRVQGGHHPLEGVAGAWATSSTCSTRARWPARSGPPDRSERQVSSASSSSWMWPLLARPCPPPGVTAPLRSVKRPPDSAMMTGTGARS